MARNATTNRTQRHRKAIEAYLASARASSPDWIANFVKSRLGHNSTNIAQRYLDCLDAASSGGQREAARKTLEILNRFSLKSSRNDDAPPRPGDE
jgi:hypothetical protein